MDSSNQKTKITLGRWGIRTLAISSSTIAVIDFLKAEYQMGALFSIGWLLIVLAEKKIFKTNTSDSS